MNKLTKTPFKLVRRLRPMGHLRRSWISETLEKPKRYKIHSNASLLRLLNRQYREIESLKAQIPQWISVDERFPTEADDRLVMVRDDSGRYNYIESRFVAPNSDEITHWMPIPALKELTNAE